MKDVTEETATDCNKFAPEEQNPKRVEHTVGTIVQGCNEREVYLHFQKKEKGEQE